MVDNAAERVLLPPEECRIWLNHLQTVMENRRGGAKKAAATRRAKRSMKDKGIPLRTMQSSVISPSEVSDFWLVF